MTRSRRVIAYAPQEVQRWIVEELAGLSNEVEAATALAHALEAVAAEPGRYILLVDVDALGADELLELERSRDGRRDRTLVALGHVTPELHRALGITHTIPRPLGSEALRNVVADLQRQRDTVNLRRISG